MSKKKRYAARLPILVKGGIRAQQPHIGASRSWWSRRWLAFMENFRLGARLGRGRSYAVSGQVSDLSIAPGEVTAQVQGSGTSPYTAVIRVMALPPEKKGSLLRQLRQHPMLLARLLVGDLPVEIEALFQEEGLPLFPQRDHDLTSHCNCPDYANPCKHLAAVYCLLGEAVARNPLLLLALRGVSHERLFNLAPKASDNRKKELIGEHPEREVPWDAASYYGLVQAPFESFGSAQHTMTPAPLICRLGALPFWRGHERFVDTLEHLYTRAATRGWTVWSGERLDLRREDEKVIIKGATLHLKQRKMRVDATRF